MSGQRADKATTEALRKEYGLDLPKSKQLLYYLRDISPISFIENSDAADQKYNYVSLYETSAQKLVIKYPYLRRSFQNNKPVTHILSEAFIGTFILASVSIIFAAILGVILGSISALNYRKPIDRIILFISTIGISAPSFFAAIIIAWFFGYVLHRYTGLSLTGNWLDYDENYNAYFSWKNLILPAFALGIRPLAIITQLMRSSTLEVLNKDYVRTAYSKGLNSKQVFRRHILKNALNPVITSLSGWFASLLAGSFFVEYIFNWKGIGKVTVDALDKSDYPVVMGAILLVASLYIVLNMVVDISYKLLDPRVELY